MNTPSAFANFKSPRRNPSPIWRLGTELPAQTQQECLRRYVHRFTAEHKPAWASKEWKDGLPYPVQFASDADWLAHTEFAVTGNGALDERIGHCFSNPTWPNNPELRK
jgi:hypothetical protein